MRTSSVLISLALLASGLPLQSAAQQSFHPARGQTAEQQKADEAHCNSWAVSQSGYDPARPPAAVAAQPAPVTGSGARVRGAAAGAAVGAIGGNDVGNAAAKGAVVGGVVRRNRNRAAASEANQAAASQQQASAAGYASARLACMEGRGYTVQ